MANSPSSTALHTLPALSVTSRVAMPASSRAASARVPSPGACRNTLGSDQRRRIPRLGVAQRDREGPQDAARALEPVQLRPLGIEDVGQVRVEGIAVEEALFRVHPILAHSLVDPGDVGHRRGDVRAEGVGVGDRSGGEEAPGAALRPRPASAPARTPSSLCRLKMSKNLRGQLLAEHVALRGVGREQRGDESAAVDLRHRLAERLEEADQPAAPVPAPSLPSRGRTSAPRRSGPGSRARAPAAATAGRRATARRAASRVPRSRRRDGGRASPLRPRSGTRARSRGCFSQRSSPAGPRASMPFSTSSLSKPERGDARGRQGRADMGPELVHRGTRPAAPPGRGRDGAAPPAYGSCPRRK